MKDAIGIAVMLNNFFHDLSAAVFFCALIGLEGVRRRSASAGEEAAALARGLERDFKRAAAWSLVFIIAFGVVRTMAYREYEWCNAAEHGQVAALVVKHVLFGILIAAAVWRVRTLRRGAPKGAP